MQNYNQIEISSVSDRMIKETQNYLLKSGAIDETYLVFNKAFAEHMLETILEESEEPFDIITDEAQARSVEYFTQNLDREAPTTMTDRDFVKGLLAYALLGIVVPIPQES